MIGARGFFLSSFLLATVLGGCASSGATHEVYRPETGGSQLFSPAVRTGGVLFLSGVIGRSGAGEVGEATMQSLTSIQGQLQGLGLSMADLVKCTVYMVDIDHYQDMNEIYQTFFPSDPPARTAIAVLALPASALVEIDCIAVAPTG